LGELDVCPRSFGSSEKEIAKQTRIVDCVNNLTNWEILFFSKSKTVISPAASPSPIFDATDIEIERVMKDEPWFTLFKDAIIQSDRKDSPLSPVSFQANKY
jgi:hypothetical protein